MMTGNSKFRLESNVRKTVSGVALFQFQQDQLLFLLGTTSKKLPQTF